MTSAVARKFLDLACIQVFFMVGGLGVRIRPLESSQSPLIAQYQHTVDPIVPDNGRMACIRKTKLAASSAKQHAVCLSALES